MAEKITVARPYAKAVFVLARDNNELDVWSKQLSTAASVVSDPQAVALLTSPKISATELADAVCDICGGGLTEQGRNFLHVLSQYRRLGVLPEIAALFETQKAEFENTVDVTVTSATPLDDKRRDSIAAGLKKRLGRDVRITCEIDESLIGGAVVRAKDLVIDGSVSGRLERLATEMMQ